MKHVLTVFLLLVASIASAQSLSRHDLLVQMESFLAHVSQDRVEWIELAPDANVRENSFAINLADSRWHNVREIVSKQIFADAESGNVLARTGVELQSGKIAYVSTRLKLSDAQITEVEIGFDERDAVVAENVIRLDPLLTLIVPAQDRMSRAELERIGRSYFRTLTDHRPIEADFDDARCNRFHSGYKVTNNPGDNVEGTGARTCVQAMQGPWGPAVEHRFPIIERERGIIHGVTLLHMGNGRQMYVNEVFKVLDGKIVLIDNLPVMLDDTDTLGFPVD